MKKLFPILLLLLTCVKGYAALPDSLLAKAKLEIMLSTQGEVVVQGSTGKKVSFKAPLGGKTGKDSIVYMKEFANSALLYSQASKALSHGKLEVVLPLMQQVRIQGKKNNLSLSGLHTAVEADLEEGAITLSDHSGSLQLYTAKGDITLRNGKAVGSVGTQQGNILLEDVAGEVSTFTREGKITRRFTNNYFSKYTDFFTLFLYQKADLELEAVPNGATLMVEQGNITVKAVRGSLQASSHEGNITIQAVQGAINAATKKGNIVLHQNYLLQAAVELITEAGDITVYLPATLLAQLSIEIHSTDSKYSIQSEYLLGEVKKETLTDSQGKVLGYKSKLEGKLNNGSIPFRIHTNNGNVFIKKLL